MRSCPRIVAACAALGALAMVGGCADPGPMESPPPEWACEVLARDGSRRPFVGRMPRALLSRNAAEATGIDAREIDAVECVWRVDGAFVRSLREPVAALGVLGKSSAGDQSATFDGQPIGEPDAPAGAVLPVALPVGADDREGHDIAVRLSAGETPYRTLMTGPGTFGVGELGAVHAALIGHFAPDLALGALMLVVALACALAAALFRRTAPRHVPALGWVVLVASSFALVRLHDNALLPFAARAAPLTTARLLAGAIILPAIVEALRSHLGLPRSRWFAPLYAAVIFGVVARVLFLAAVGPVWFLSVADAVSVGAGIYIVVLGVVSLRQKAPGSVLLAAATFLAVPFFFMRMTWSLMQRLLPDTSVWFIAVLVMTLVLVVARNVAAEQARLLRGKLVARYVPRQLVTRVLEGQLPERKRMALTVFFSDLPGFGDVARQLAAEVVASLLSEYLTRMTHIAERHGATVDKLLGDGVMVFFGAPEPMDEAEGARACVRMAEEMHAAIAELQPGWRERGMTVPLSARMGMNTGTAVVGDLGSSRRAGYTVVGTTVNLASRLRARCPPGKILLSEATRGLLAGDVATEPLGAFTPKGFQRAFEIHLLHPGAAR